MKHKAAVSITLFEKFIDFSNFLKIRTFAKNDDVDIIMAATIYNSSSFSEIPYDKMEAKIRIHCG